MKEKTKKQLKFYSIILAIILIVGTLIFFIIQEGNSSKIPEQVEESLIQSSNYKLEFIDPINNDEAYSWRYERLTIDIHPILDDGDYIHEKGYIIVYGTNEDLPLDIDVLARNSRVQKDVWFVEEFLSEYEHQLSHENIWEIGMFSIEKLGFEHFDVTIENKKYYPSIGNTNILYTGDIIIEIWGSDTDFADAKMLDKLELHYE